MKSNIVLSHNEITSDVLLRSHCVVPENIHTPTPTEGILPMTPLPSGFSKISLTKWTPPLPSGNSIFFAHPLEILSFLVETKNKVYFNARY